MKATYFMKGQIINFLPTNNCLVRRAKVLDFNFDGSLKCLEIDDHSIVELWNAGYEVSSVVYMYQIV